MSFVVATSLATIAGVSSAQSLPMLDGETTTPTHAETTYSFECPAGSSTGAYRLVLIRDRTGTCAQRGTRTSWAPDPYARDRKARLCVVSLLVRRQRYSALAASAEALPCYSVAAIVYSSPGSSRVPHSVLPSPPLEPSRSSHDDKYPRRASEHASTFGQSSRQRNIGLSTLTAEVIMRSLKLVIGTGRRATRR